MNAPSRLRVEHFDEPMGITVRCPRLSWQLPAGYGAQTAYQLQVEDWDSGRVDSAQHLLVPYDGPSLRSGQRVSWRVRVWDGEDVSEWSSEGTWEMGLLETADWIGRWIAPVEDVAALPPLQRPAHYLRRSFTLDAIPDRVRLYATAHGIYEAYLNGQRVGDLELTPGFTSYRNILHVQTYDVTGLLVPGENVLGFVLSDGWYRGQTGFTRAVNGFGDSLALLAQLVGYEQAHVLIGTDASWRHAYGAITGADLMEGQATDLREELLGRAEAGFDDASWSLVVESPQDFSRLRGSPAPPVRAVERLAPRSVTKLKDDRYVVDLGQNINGWVQLKELGAAGARLSLTHGEALDASGDVTVEHLRGINFETQEPLSAGQLDVVVSAGRPEDVFEPRHTTHGFQFVRVEGALESLDVEDVTGVVVHSDLRRTGWFQCSDERLNQLHEAAVWSFRDNACDVPTDCPQRERSGWTGDYQLFFPTAAFLFDVAGFTTKWLHDLAADQWPDGRVPNCTPDPSGPAAYEILSLFTGSAGWGDAAAIVPWLMHETYADRRILEEQYDSMVAWLGFARRLAAEARFPEREAARPVPAEHEKYLWDTGFHWGEWLEPGASLNLDAGPLAALGQGDKGDVATAYFHLTARIVADVARLLARPDEAQRYAELAECVRTAWQKEFIGPDGALHPDTQANHVRALAFGLVPEEHKAAVVRRLVELIREAGTHLGTGFLATPYLLPVLADHGQVDLAYELLLQDSPPSWLAMIKRGATTIWEEWEGIDADGVAHASLNHYSKGAAISFLHTHTGGLKALEPAYRRFAVAPVLGGGLTWAETVFESPHGRIESSWRLDGGTFTLDVTVPGGATAVVTLPDGSSVELGPGSAQLSCDV